MNSRTHLTPEMQRLDALLKPEEDSTERGNGMMSGAEMITALNVTGRQPWPVFIVPGEARGTHRFVTGERGQHMTRDIRLSPEAIQLAQDSDQVGWRAPRTAPASGLRRLSDQPVPDDTTRVIAYNGDRAQQRALINDIFAIIADTPPNQPRAENEQTIRRLIDRMQPAGGTDARITLSEPLVLERNGARVTIPATPPGTNASLARLVEAIDDKMIPPRIDRPLSQDVAATYRPGAAPNYAAMDKRQLWQTYETQVSRMAQEIGQPLALTADGRYTKQEYATVRDHHTRIHENNARITVSDEIIVDGNVTDAERRIMKQSEEGRAELAAIKRGPLSRDASREEIIARLEIFDREAPIRAQEQMSSRMFDMIHTLRSGDTAGYVERLTAATAAGDVVVPQDLNLKDMGTNPRQTYTIPAGKLGRADLNTVLMRNAGLNEQQQATVTAAVNAIPTPASRDANARSGNGQDGSDREAPASQPATPTATAEFPREGNAKRWGGAHAPSADRVYVPQDRVDDVQQLLLNAGLPIARNAALTAPDNKWGPVTDTSFAQLVKHAGLELPVNVNAPGVMDRLTAASREMAGARGAAREGTGQETAQRENVTDREDAGHETDHREDVTDRQDAGHETDHVQDSTKTGTMTLAQLQQARTLRTDLRTEMMGERANNEDVTRVETLITQHDPKANGIMLGDGHLSVDERAAAGRIAEAMSKNPEGIMQLNELVRSMRGNNTYGTASTVDDDPMQFAAAGTPAPLPGSGQRELM